ncbi:hypothetical protein [Caulobacter segnis]|uniref:Uncharacterized protein n=1 Tax=Caulobacter segnis TaxID=88688 RepID=A0A2W5V3K0_9CAUL|nr:hypothetical protein [Caulobacter segnis]PZR34390.1 MAG: hypothetical protein DI526_10295 [Caulobacter segnis]
MDIRQQADREIDAAPDKTVGFLLPEDEWEAFLAATGGEVRGDPPETVYRGARFRRAPVTMITHEEGF